MSYGWIQASQTGGQPFRECSPYKVSRPVTLILANPWLSKTEEFWQNILRCIFSLLSAYGISPKICSRRWRWHFRNVIYQTLKLVFCQKVFYDYYIRSCNTRLGHLKSVGKLNLRFADSVFIASGFGSDLKREWHFVSVQHI